MTLRTVFIGRRIDSGYGDYASRISDGTTLPSLSNSRRGCSFRGILDSKVRRHDTRPPPYSSEVAMREGDMSGWVIRNLSAADVP